MFRISRVTALPLLSVCAFGVSAVLASSGEAKVAPITYIQPNNGLVISGQAGPLAVTLRVRPGHPPPKQGVQLDVSCYKHFVARGRAVIGYNNFVLIRHAEFSIGGAHTAFRADGYFSTPYIARVHLRLQSLRAQARCNPRGRQILATDFVLGIKMVRNPGTAPWPQGQVSLRLTQCPSNARSNPLLPSQHFQIRGQVLPAHAREIVRVEYTTVQGQPATGKPTSFSYTQRDGTFTADFGVPNNNSIAAEAGISASAFGKTATCTFFDK